LPDCDQEVCLEYCGLTLKKMLLEFCVEKEVSNNQLPQKLQVTASEIDELKKKFKVSKTNGYGQIENVY
jgi:hypothetical protein